MASLASVKKRAESKSGRVLILLALLLLSAGAGRLAWRFTGRMVPALAAGGILALVLAAWWLLLSWRSAVTRLCELQLALARLNLLPRDFAFWDKASPFNAASRVEETLSAAGRTVQETEKGLAAGRHTLDKYLGSEASRQAQGGASSLGGQVQKVFILFSDIRGFTRMSEALTPQETMRVLNQVYTSLGAAIEAHGGEINKFIGDAVLAYFRRSSANEKADAEKAVRAALEMQGNFGRAVKASADLASQPASIGLGIGLVAGEALMGNLGTRNRMEFTLIGDSVNLASRLCGIAPEWEILVNEEMALLVKDRFHIESRMPVQLKGKSEKVVPYSILGEMR